MAVTVELRIHIQKKFGVRIEDSVIVVPTSFVAQVYKRACRDLRNFTL